MREYRNQWLIVINQFSPEDIWNADGTALYYRAVPEYTPKVFAEERKDERGKYKLRNA